MTTRTNTEDEARQVRQEQRLEDARARRIQSDLRTATVRQHGDVPTAPGAVPLDVPERLNAVFTAGAQELAERLAEEGLTPDQDWLGVEYARSAAGWRAALRAYHWTPALVPHEQAKLVEFFQGEVTNLVTALVDNALELRRRETAWANSRLNEWTRNRKRFAAPASTISEDVADLLFGPDVPTGGYLEHGFVNAATDLGDGATLHRITYPAPQENNR
jgi:hypothetical protein